MILDFMSDVNWLAVIASAAAALVIGLVWFSPAVLGAFWARRVSAYAGIPEDEVTSAAGQPAPLAKWLAGIAVSALTMALAVEAVEAESAGDGAVLGLVLGLGLGATVCSWPPIFARMPWAWWLVNSAAFVLMQVAMGAILAAWH